VANSPGSGRHLDRLPVPDQGHELDEENLQAVLVFPRPRRAARSLGAYPWWSAPRLSIIREYPFAQFVPG